MKAKKKFVRVKDKELEEKLNNKEDILLERLSEIVYKLKEIQMEKCNNCNNEELCKKKWLECYENILNKINKEFNPTIYSAYFLNLLFVEGAKIIFPKNSLWRFRNMWWYS